MNPDDLNKKLLDIVETDRQAQESYAKTLQMESEDLKKMHKRDRNINIILSGVIILIMIVFVIMFLSNYEIDIGIQTQQIRIQTDDKNNSNIYFYNNGKNFSDKERGENNEKRY